MLFTLAWPLGEMQTAVGRAQDHAEAALHILDEDERLSTNPTRTRKVLNWNDRSSAPRRWPAAPPSQATQERAGQPKAGEALAG